MLKSEPKIRVKVIILGNRVEVGFIEIESLAVNLWNVSKEANVLGFVLSIIIGYRDTASYLYVLHI